MKLKIKSKPTFNRVVDYFGIPISVNDEACWVAADSDGKVYVYFGQSPTTGTSTWDHRGDCTSANVAVDLTDIDWKDTLKHYISVKPEMRTYYMKEFDFHGLKVVVPDDGYLAMDEDGSVWWYKERPRESHDIFKSECNHFMVGRCSLPRVPWEKSLVKIG